MSASWFHLAVSGLITLLLLFASWPWLMRKRRSGYEERTRLQNESATAYSGTTSNIALIRQRLLELEEEARQGLITDQDARQASDELKLALVDEHRDSAAQNTQSATGWIVAGAILAVACAGLTYIKANHLGKLAYSEQAVAALPGLSRKLTEGSAQDFTQQDLNQLTLAIRQRLRWQADDAQGWMFLGRIYAAAGREDEAREALSKAYNLDNTNEQIVSSYIQALMAGSQADNVRHAKSLLSTQLSRYPGNNNYALMMAVAAAQLGDLDTTERYYAQVESLLPRDSQIRQSLQTRIAEMGGQVTEEQSPLSLTITVSLGPDIDPVQLPETGFLIVFAQQQDGSNRMPAAVVKQPLSALPVTVTLTEADAMTPAFTLAQLSKAKLVARISADEDVMPAIGDFEGVSMVDLTSQGHSQQSIMINKELK